jgi:CO/xanthine dehydrogenase Mo-binding subunit
VSDGERIDLRDKVTGRAQYIDDLPVPPGTMRAFPLESPYLHARILSIDSSSALALPGVRRVFDREHLDGLKPITVAPEVTAWLLGIPSQNVRVRTPYTPSRSRPSAHGHCPRVPQGAGGACSDPKLIELRPR